MINEWDIFEIEFAAQLFRLRFGTQWELKKYPFLFRITLEINGIGITNEKNILNVERDFGDFHS